MTGVSSAGNHGPEFGRGRQFRAESAERVADPLAKKEISRFEEVVRYVESRGCPKNLLAQFAGQVSLLAGQSDSASRQLAASFLHRVEMDRAALQGNVPYFGPPDWALWLMRANFQVSCVLNLLTDSALEVVELPDLPVKVPSYSRVHEKLVFERGEDGMPLTTKQQKEQFDRYLGLLPPWIRYRLNCFFELRLAYGGRWVLEIRSPEWLKESSPHRVSLERLFEAPPLSELVAITNTAKVPLDTVPFRRGAEDILIGLCARGESRQPHAYLTAGAFEQPFGLAPRERALVQALELAVVGKHVRAATIELSGSVDRDFLRWVVGENVADPGACPHVRIIYALPLPSGSECRFVLKRGVGGFNVAEDSAHFEGRQKDIVNGLRRAILDHRLPDVLGKVPDQAFPKLSEFLIGKGWASASIPLAIANPHWISDLAGLEIFCDERERGLWAQLASLGERSLENEANTRSVFTPWGSEAGIREALRALQETGPARTQGAPDWQRITSGQVESVVQETLRRVRGIREHEESRTRAECDSSTVDFKLAQQRQELGWPGRHEGIALDIDGIIVDIVGAMNRVGAEAARDGRTFKLGSYDFPERFLSLPALPRKLSEIVNNRYVEVKVFDSRRASTTVHRMEAVSGTERVDRIWESVLATNVERLLEAYSSGLLGSGPQRGQKFIEAEQRWLQFQRKQIELLQQTWAKRFRAGQDRPPDASGNRPRSTVSADYREAKRGLHEFLVAELKKRIESAGLVVPDLVRVVSILDQDVQKFIYVVNADLSVTVSPEGYRNERKQKSATHSELSRGRNVYGAGELIFSRHNRSFFDYHSWKSQAAEFDFKGPWQFDAITNGSGHYRPSATTLRFVRKVVTGILRSLPDPDRLVLVSSKEPAIEDTLTKGVGLSLLFTRASLGGRL